MYWSRRITIARRRATGFTLAEVLVALTLLAVGIIGVLSAITLSQRATTTGMHRQHAALLAERVLAEAVAQPAAQLVPAEGEEGRFAWSLSFADRDHQLKLASVTIEWLDRGEAQTFELAQVFAPRQASQSAPDE